MPGRGRTARAHRPVRPLPVGPITGLVRGIDDLVARLRHGAWAAIVLATLEALLLPDHLGDLLLVLGVLVVLVPAWALARAATASLELAAMRSLAARTAEEAASPIIERHRLAKGPISRLRDIVGGTVLVTVVLAISCIGLGLGTSEGFLVVAALLAVIAVVGIVMIVVLSPLRRGERDRWEEVCMSWPGPMPVPTAHPLSLVDRAIEDSLLRRVLAWTIRGIVIVHLVWWVILPETLSELFSPACTALGWALLLAVALAAGERFWALARDAYRRAEAVRDVVGVAQDRAARGEAPSAERAAAQEMLRDRHPLRALGMLCAAASGALAVLALAVPWRDLVVLRFGASLPMMMRIPEWATAFPGPLLDGPRGLLASAGVLGPALPVDPVQLVALGAAALLGLLALGLLVAARRALASHRTRLYEAWPQLDPVLGKRRVVSTDEDGSERTSWKTLYSRGSPPVAQEKFAEEALDTPR